MRVVDSPRSKHCEAESISLRRGCQHAVCLPVRKSYYSCDYNLKYLLVPGMSEEGYCPVLHSKFATAEGLRQIIFFDVGRCNKGSAPEARL